MCGSAPRVERRDLQAEQRQADAEATRRANTEIAQRRARRQSQSLIANPGGAAGITGGSVISQPIGKERLG